MTDIYFPPDELVTTDAQVSSAVIRRPWIPTVNTTIDITWNPLPADLCLGYNIYRSIVDNTTEYTQLNDALLEVLFYRDTNVPIQPNTEYWYRITYKNTIGVESNIEDAASFRLISEIDNLKGLIPLKQIITEIVWRHDRILETNGVPCTMFVRKMAGTLCTCFNEYIDLPLEGDICRKCFGTKFIGGYFRIPNVIVRFHSYVAAVEYSQYGVIGKAAPKSWLLDYPPLHNGDIVYKNYSGERYILSDVNRVLTHDHITRQEFNANLLTPKEALYNLLPTG